MRQNEFIFRVEQEENVIKVSTYDIGGVFLIEEKITKLYPQLESIGLKEESEGVMLYEGEMDFKELKAVLNNWGFILEHTDKHIDLISEKDIPCKIEPRYEEAPYYTDYTRPVVDGVVQPPLERKTVEQLVKEMNEAAENDKFDLAIQIREEINRRQNEK